MAVHLKGKRRSNNCARAALEIQHVAHLLSTVPNADSYMLLAARHHCYQRVVLLARPVPFLSNHSAHSKPRGNVCICHTLLQYTHSKIARCSQNKPKPLCVLQQAKLEAAIGLAAAIARQHAHEYDIRPIRSLKDELCIEWQGAN
jgi:hypothetical protein